MPAETRESVTTSDAPLELRIGPWRIRTTPRGALLFAGFVLAGGAGYAGLAQTVGLATSEQVEGLATKATAAISAQVQRNTVTLGEHTTAIGEHTAVIQSIVVTQAELRDSQREDRAERLADRAADRVKDARKSREVWQRVKARAIQNQRGGLPIRDGVESLVE